MCMLHIDYCAPNFQKKKKLFWTFKNIFVSLLFDSSPHRSQCNKSVVKNFREMNMKQTISIKLRNKNPTSAYLKVQNCHQESNSKAKVDENCVRFRILFDFDRKIPMSVKIQETEYIFVLKVEGRMVLISKSLPIIPAGTNSK